MNPNYEGYAVRCFDHGGTGMCSDRIIDRSSHVAAGAMLTLPEDSTLNQSNSAMEGASEQSDYDSVDRRK